MVIGRRLETALAFFVGLALGIMCTLHNKILEAQEKNQPQIVWQDGGGQWKLLYTPRGLELPPSRETRNYIRQLMERKLRLQWREFEQDYLFEQFGEKGKPKQVKDKIWCFRQALHAAVWAYPGCPPNEDAFPELVEELELKRVGRLAEGWFDYLIDGVIYAPNDLGPFAKKRDKIYVVQAAHETIGEPHLTNYFWVNARTGQVAALFPPAGGYFEAGPRRIAPLGSIVLGIEVLLQPPKR